MKIKVKFDHQCPGCFTLKAFLKPAVFYSGYTVEEAKAHYTRLIREG